MSGRRTSGSSRPSLGVQVLAVFSFISWGKPQFKKSLGKHLEVPDVLLPDICGLLCKRNGELQECTRRGSYSAKGRVSAF